MSIQYSNSIINLISQCYWTINSISHPTGSLIQSNHYFNSITQFNWTINSIQSFHSIESLIQFNSFNKPTQLHSACFAWQHWIRKTPGIPSLPEKLDPSSPDPRQKKSRWRTKIWGNPRCGDYCELSLGEEGGQAGSISWRRKILELSFAESSRIHPAESQFRGWGEALMAEGTGCTKAWKGKTAWPLWNRTRNMS